MAVSDVSLKDDDSVPSDLPEFGLPWEAERAPAKPARDVTNVRRGPAPSAPPRSDETWAELWFTLVRHPWRTLAVVPAVGENAAAAARALAESGRLYHHEPVEVLDFERITPHAVTAALALTAERAAAGARVLVAVGCPLRQPAAVPIARATDAAVLLLPLGDTETAHARRVIDLVGGERFVGCVTTRR